MKEKVFVSSTVRVLRKEREIIRKVLKDQRLHPIMSETQDFDKNQAQFVHSHDLCLNELKKCKSFIFIIGEDYGGIYKGTAYEKEKQEILKLSENKITDPSISLMEFYVAKKNQLKCFVFGDSIIEEKKNNGEVADDIKKEIDFINHFKLPSQKAIKGNWIDWYTGMDDLSNRIRKLKFI